MNGQGDWEGKYTCPTVLSNLKISKENSNDKVLGLLTVLILNALQNRTMHFKDVSETAQREVTFNFLSLNLTFEKLFKVRRSHDVWSPVIRNHLEIIILDSFFFFFLFFYLVPPLLEFPASAFSSVKHNTGDHRDHFMMSSLMLIPHSIT